MAFVHLYAFDLLARNPPTLQHAERPSDPRESHAGSADDGRREIDGLSHFGSAVTAHIENDGAVGLVVGAQHVRHQAGIEADPPHRRRSVPAAPSPAPRGTTPIQPSAPGTHPNGTAGEPP